MDNEKSYKSSIPWLNADIKREEPSITSNKSEKVEDLGDGEIVEPIAANKIYEQSEFSLHHPKIGFFGKLSLFLAAISAALLALGVFLSYIIGRKLWHFFKFVLGSIIESLIKIFEYIIGHIIMLSSTIFVFGIAGYFILQQFPDLQYQLQNFWWQIRNYL